MLRHTTALLLVFSGVLLLASCRTPSVTEHGENAGTIQGVRQETSMRAGYPVVTYYRGEEKILEKIAPQEDGKNDIYYIFLDGRKIFTYKSGPVGTEFRSSDNTRKFAKRPYTIKMAGDKESRVRRITIYSPDFKETMESFWLRDNQIIPWSSERLEGWRGMRDPESVGRSPTK